MNTDTTKHQQTNKTEFGGRRRSSIYIIYIYIYIAIRIYTCKLEQIQRNIRI